MEGEVTMRREGAGPVGERLEKPNRRKIRKTPAPRLPDTLNTLSAFLKIIRIRIAQYQTKYEYLLGLILHLIKATGLSFRRALGAKKSL